MSRGILAVAMLLRATLTSGESPDIGRFRDSVASLVSEHAVQAWGRTQFSVVEVLGPVNGLSILLVEPPYREFPNAIIFKDDGKKAILVKEALGLGVGEIRIDRDLHSLGEAVDMTVDPELARRGGSYSIGTRVIADVLAAAADNQGSVSVYPRFIHLHPGGSSTYFVDRTYLKTEGPAYAQAAALGVKADFWSAETCEHFDVPAPISGVLNHDGKRWHLKVRVKGLREQIWNVSFGGIDKKGQLTNRSIQFVSLTGKVNKKKAEDS